MRPWLLILIQTLLVGFTCALPLWSSNFEDEDQCTSRATMRSPSDGELLSFHYIVLHVQCKPKCFVPGMLVALHVDDYEEPAAVFACDNGHTHSAVLHTTRNKWVGDFSALVRTMDAGGSPLDSPYRVEFKVFFPPGLEPKGTPVRVTPWLEEFSTMFGFHDYTMLTPSGVPELSTLRVVNSNNSQWCVMERVMFDDGHFLLVDENESLKLPAPFHPTMGTAKHWGPRRGVAFERYLAPGPKCDRTIHKNAYFFGMAKLDDHVEILNGAFLALYATILEVGGEIDTENTVLITNVGAPVESGLGRYVKLFRILSNFPIISISELRSHGILCFDKIVFGLSGGYDLLSPTVDVSRLLPEMNNFVRNSLDIEIETESPTAVSVPTLLWVSRDHTRNVVNENEIMSLARTLGFAPILVKFEDYSMEEQISLVQNASVLVGVSGGGLANALWMRRGAVVIQILPYGYQSHMGEEIERIAKQGPGHYISFHLGSESVGRWPWPPPPIVLADPEHLWNWHAPGHGPGEEEGEEHHDHDHGGDTEHKGAHGHSHRSLEEELHEDYTGTHGHATAVLLYSGVKDITVDLRKMGDALMAAKTKLQTVANAAFVPNVGQMLPHLPSHSPSPHSHSHSH